MVISIATSDAKHLAAAPIAADAPKAAKAPRTRKKASTGKRRRVARGTEPVVTATAAEPVVVAPAVELASDVPATATATTVVAEASEPTAASTFEGREAADATPVEAAPRADLVSPPEVDAALAAIPSLSPAPMVLRAPVTRTPVRSTASGWHGAAGTRLVARPVLTIDDDRPELAEQLQQAKQHERASRRIFLPPIVVDGERGARQGGLTLAVIILIIAATLTLSYLMRSPSASGEGVTALPRPTSTLVA